MKKIAFVFVAAIVASVAVSMSSCKKGEAGQDTAAQDTTAQVVEAPADTTAAPADTTAAPADTTAQDSAAAPQA